MPPKKIAPFWCFVTTYRDSKRREGKNISIAQAKAEAEILWRELSEDDKYEFAERARRETDELRTRMFHEQKDAAPAPIDPIVSIVKQYLASIHDLKTFRFIFAHFNHRCCGDMSSHGFEPVELGLCHYSINEGIGDQLHCIIYPGPVSAHCEASALDTAARTHMVVPRDTSDSVSDMRLLAKEIHDFAQPLKVVLCAQDDHQKVLECLRFILRNGGDESLKVLPIHGEKVFEQLASLSGSKAKKQIRYERLEIDLEIRDKFACGYHQKVKRESFCSLVSVVQMAYTFAHSLSQPYCVFTRPGYHTPQEGFKFNIKTVAKQSENVPVEKITQSLENTSIREKPSWNQEFPADLSTRVHPPTQGMRLRGRGRGRGIVPAKTGGSSSSHS